MVEAFAFASEEAVAVCVRSVCCWSDSTAFCCAFALGWLRMSVTMVLNAALFLAALSIAAMVCFIEEEVGATVGVMPAFLTTSFRKSGMLSSSAVLRTTSYMSPSAGVGRNVFAKEPSMEPTLLPSSSVVLMRRHSSPASKAAS